MRHAGFVQRAEESLTYVAQTEPRTRRPLARPLLLAAAAALLLAAVLGARAGGGTAAAAQAANPSDPNGMNVVMVLTDDQPLHSLKYMRYLSKRGAREGWTNFSGAVAQNPLCCPSRASMLTGLYSHRHGVARNSDAALFDDRDTVATWLQNAGYETGFVGKYLNGYPWDRGDDFVPAGWNHWVGVVGKPRYNGYTLSNNGSHERYRQRKRDYMGRVLEQHSIDYVKRNTGPGTNPFFLFVSHYAPHEPATPDPRDVGKYKNKKITLTPNINERDVSDKPQWVRNLGFTRKQRIRKRIRKRAEAALSVDRLIRRVVQQLRRRGELENTMLVFASDHGYAIGEHRHKKKACAYEACVGIPLMIRYPGSPLAGRSVKQVVANMDFAPTIADAMGVVPPAPARDGRSLVPWLDGRQTPRSRPILIQKANRTGASPMFWGLRTSRYKYVELETGETEFYDLRKDPFELENRSGRPQMAELEQSFAEQFDRLVPVEWPPPPPARR
jgi:N-acetylglucosamine-6-sulfatase